MPRGRPPLADRSTNRPEGHQTDSKGGHKGLLRCLNEFLEEIDHEVEERCEGIKDLEQTAIQELREKLTALVLGLPSRTRGMSITAFREQSFDPAEPMRQVEARAGGGLLAATPEYRGRSSRDESEMTSAAAGGMPSVSRTTRKRARELANLGGGGAIPETGARALRSLGANVPPNQMMATPVGSRIRAGSSIAATPDTVRFPRPNEVVFSQNGSPFGTFQGGVITPLPSRPEPHATPMFTAFSRPLGKGQMQEAGAGMALNLTLGDGRSVQIKSAQDVEALGDDLKPLAYEQLKAMNEWTAGLTAQFGEAAK